MCQKFTKFKIYSLFMEAPNCQTPKWLIEICFYFWDNIFSPLWHWSGWYEYFARFLRRGRIDCMPLYAQACNATFSVRLDTKYILCPNGRKKSARFKGRKCSYRPLQPGKCLYRLTFDCPRLTTRSHATRLFPPIWTQNVVCTSSDMVTMWLVRIPPSLRSGGYTSGSSQSPPCRPWYTIYY